ncbi:MFS transporter [Arthrobacter sp. NPDC080073]|uniref:MFS transporter n=1 Tax=Arthrobacter sp. NPDC080073 TaxID=3155919 RepID=UPI003428C8DB
MVLALSLRAPIIAPTTVIGDIQAGTGLSAAGAGLLIGIPVLLFAIATPLATRTIRRFGPETTVILCLIGVLAGTVLRSIGGAAVMLLGTAIIATAMALGNIVVPVIIRRDVPWRKAAAATGAYSATVNVGSMVALVSTPPLATLVGWRAAIAACGVVTAAGLAYWLLREWPRLHSPTANSPRISDGPGAAAATADPLTKHTRNRRIVAHLILTFCGQTAAFYGTTAWLPLLLSETRGLGPAASGATASLFQVAAIIGAFGVPLLAARTKMTMTIAVIAVFWVALPVGLLAAPEAFVLWSIIGGVAQGGGFTAVFAIVSQITQSNAEAASASARIQGVGYLAATVAPPLAGWLNTSTGGWTAPLLLVLGATFMFTINGLWAARLSERRTNHAPNRVTQPM